MVKVITDMGTPGDDTLTSLSGPETIDGGDGTDIITIDRGDDTAGLTYNATKAATDAGWTMEDGTVVRNVEKLDTLTTGTGYDILYVTTAQDGFHWYAGGSDISGTSGDELHFDATNDASAITTHTNEDANGGFDYTIVDAANGIESDAYQLGRVSIHGGSADDHLTGSGTVSGGTGDDTLDGGVGADTMEGGWGSDIYYVDNPGDVIIEGVDGVDDGSLDLVISSIDYTLTDPLLEGLILSGHDNINATGNADDNYIMGNDGNNVLSGLDGNDVLVDTLGGHDTFLGGAGDDSIEAGIGADSIDGGSGTNALILDRSDSTIDLTFDGPAAATDTGFTMADGTVVRNIQSESVFTGSGNDHLIGGIGDDSLNGGAGADTMEGGDGNDGYFVDNPGDVVIEGAGPDSGEDTVYSTISYTLGDNFEDLDLLGSDSIDGTGNALDNFITGNVGDNRLSGLGGDDILGDVQGMDTLLGGDGNDVIIAGQAAQPGPQTGHDLIDGGEGYDALSLYLPYATQDLVYDSSAAATETGLTMADGTVVKNIEEIQFLVTGSGNDSLHVTADQAFIWQAGDGADSLNFDASADTDGYFVQTRDDTAGGFDISLESFDGSQAYAYGIEFASITGGSGDDTMAAASAGVVFHGGDGDDLLAGGIGNDTLAGDAGNDTVTGGGGNDQLFGGDGDDSLTAGDDRTYLDGGNGTDTLIGGAGNDYIYDIYDGHMNTLTGNGGDDTIQGDGTLSGGDGNDSIGYVVGHTDDGTLFLGASVTGGDGDDIIYALFSGTHVMAAPNTLDGGAGNNSITGSDDSDILIGGTGADTMRGGAGNDIYYVDNIGDVVSEEVTPGHDAGGHDLVYSTISYTLPTFVEDLTLTANNVDGTGNALNNIIHGNNGVNVLTGLDGDDVLLGAGGNDTLDGGTGNDYLDAGDGNDRVVGGVGNDTLMGGTGADTLYGGAGDDTYYVDDSHDVVSEQTTIGTDDGGHDIVYSTVDFTLGAFLEDLTLQGLGDINGTGNTLANNIHGNNGNNVLLGMDGNDTLTGGGGIDSLDGGTGNDYLDGGAGDDTIHGGDGNDSILGGADNDLIFGDVGNDTLNGGAGIDTMHGGAGDDVYYVDNVADVVTEEMTPGTDDGGHDIVYSTVTFTLGNFVEDLTLTGVTNIDGTGNTLDNNIHGNNADNVLTGLDGNDSLLGGGGNDRLDGGNGNDYLDAGTGNDTIVGGAGNDTLMGAGTLTMHGGADNDTYYVANAGQVVSEETTPGIDDGGHDIVYSAIGYTLGNFVEDLTLMASAGAANGTGNALNNIIHGNNSDNVITGLDGDDIVLGGGGNDTVLGGNGNDYLDGGPGNDVLTGGDGADRFAFEYTGAANGVDTVTDYVHGTDSLWFNGADYGVAVGGALTSDMFTAGTSAVGTHGQFIWDASSHTLYWDDDGTGGDTAVAIATFTGVTTIDTSDFHFK